MIELLTTNTAGGLRGKKERREMGWAGWTRAMFEIFLASSAPNDVWLSCSNQIQRVARKRKKRGERWGEWAKRVQHSTYGPLLTGRLACAGWPAKYFLASSAPKRRYFRVLTWFFFNHRKKRKILNVPLGWDFQWSAGSHWATALCGLFL